jgi:hypothetical protein
VSEMTDRELEAALRDVGAHLAYPRGADLLPAVRARIGEERRGAPWALLRWPRAAFLPALATVALLLVATLAFQPIGASALEAIGIGRLTIFRGAGPAPSPTATPARASVLPDAVKVTSVEEASRQAGFAVLVPAELGRPDEVYVAPGLNGGTVFLVYAPRPGIPAAKQTGIGVLVTQVPGAFELALLGKVLPPGSRAEEVTVNGGRGAWIEGAPHQIFFRTASGQILTDTLRLAGNVLAWERGSVFVRIEADIPKDLALRIASSMR